MSRYFIRGSTASGGLVSSGNFIVPGLNDWTYSAWIYPTSFPPVGGNNSGWIIALDSTDYGIFLLPTGSLKGITSKDKNLSNAISSTGLIQLNVWQYVTYTFTSSTGVSQLFINGVEVTYISQANHVVSEATAFPIEIGNQETIFNTPVTYAFDGYIDTIGVWASVLTPSQMIAASKYGGTPITDVAHLSGYWPLTGLTLPEPQSPVNTNPLGVDTSNVLNTTPGSGPDSPGQTPTSVPSKDNKVTSIFTIQKATLISNIAYFQVDACPALEIGGTVVVAGCTTSTFNTTLTVLTCGTFIIPNAIADTKGGVQLWTGFSAALTNANIAIEIEPTLPTDGAEGSPAGTATGTVTQ